MKRSIFQPVGLRRVSDYPEFRKPELREPELRTNAELRSPELRTADAVASVGQVGVPMLRRAIGDPLDLPSSDAELLADFADFLCGERGCEDGGPTHPDPAFRERLRSRLWRTHVHTCLREFQDLH